MQPTTSTALSLRQLRELYLRHAEKHYRRRSGQPTREHLNMRAAIDHYMHYAGEGFDLARLNRHQIRAWLDQLAAEKLSRPYINACLSRLRRFARWCADLDYISTSPVEQLRLVKPLQPFRTDAREPVKKAPPAIDHFDRILPFLAQPARDVIQLLRLTGARPSELLELTNAEVHIDEHGARLCPLQHKSAHRGKSRVIPLSNRAAAIIDRHWRPLLPADQLFPSSRRSTARGHFTIDGLRAAVKRACKRAGVSGFELYDVRRRVAREVRRAGGLDAAQALLGHSKASTTEIYAPIDETQTSAFDAARRATEVL